MVIFSFLLLRSAKTSEALKKRPKFWILDIKVCIKKLGIGSGLYGKSVLYLVFNDLWQVPQQIKLADSFERDLPEIWGTCQTNIFSCEGHVSHLELLESSLLAV